MEERERHGERERQKERDRQTDLFIISKVAHMLMEAERRPDPQWGGGPRIACMSGRVPGWSYRLRTQEKLVFQPKSEVSEEQYPSSCIQGGGVPSYSVIFLFYSLFSVDCTRPTHIREGNLFNEVYDSNVYSIWKHPHRQTPSVSPFRPQTPDAITKIPCRYPKVSFDQ